MGHTGDDRENERWPLPRFLRGKCGDSERIAVAAQNDRDARRFQAYEGLNVGEFRPYVEQALPAK